MLRPLLSWTSHHFSGEEVSEPLSASDMLSWLHQ